MYARACCLRRAAVPFLGTIPGGTSTTRSLANRRPFARIDYGWKAAVLFIDGKAQKLDTEKSDGSPLSVEDKKAIFEAYDVPDTGQDSKLQGWRQLSENHFIRGDGRVHIVAHPTSMTIFWDDLPREFW